MTCDPLAEPLAPLIGPRAAKALAGLGLTTVEDLVRHYPRRYETHGQLTDLASLRVGEQVTVLARVADVRVRDLGQRRKPRWIVEVRVTDGVGGLTLTFFNQRHQAERLRVGKVGLFAGTVGVFRDQRQLLHPDYELLAETEAGDPLAGLAAVESFANRMIAVYPAAEKVPSWQIARAVATVLPHIADLPDPLDDALRAEHGVIGLAQALEWKHRPVDRSQVAAADERLRWDEALGVQLILALGRAELSQAEAQARAPRPDGIAAAFDARLPFELTRGQREIGEVLCAELGRSHPMHRLLQGEVGSGKTVVALRAMLQVIDAGGQAVLLAPTEVLAAQHARTINGMLGPLAQAGMLGGDPAATRLTLLTGSLGAAAKRAALLEAAGGGAGIVVGTHALLQEHVQFADLALVVVDEQHRFGVAQRAALVERAGGLRPHTLVMTATPIPRTVAMTVFGELDVSTLAELPAGRPATATHVVPAAELPGHLVRAWQRAREEVAAGRQVYVVCPRIDADAGEPGDADDAPRDADDEPAPGGKGTNGPAPAAAVSSVLPALVEGPLAGLRLGALTGRLSAADKDDVMARFLDPTRADGIDVLVATTVIEVGVDVPNASMMVVLDADRFGISQLHQLRGRIRRGRHPGLCLLVTQSPADSPARERLAAVAATDDGFALSRIDLAARSEGDVLGAAQHGARRALRLLSVLRDEDVIVRARDAAARLVAADPGLADHRLLASQLAAWFDDDQAEYLGADVTRIIAGAARGRRLSVPGSARPTTDRVRESLFSALEHLVGGFDGIAVLDLYSGSGALGLESASRGAARVVLVESDARAARVARQNVAAVGLPGVEVVTRTVAGHLGGPAEPFDVVLADPPYDLPARELAGVLTELVAGWLTGSAVVVVERSSRDPDLTWPTGIVALRKLTFGTTTLWYGQAVLPGQDL